MARLHTEQIAAAGVTPDAWLLMTHGIYGTGGNWRGIARRLVAQRPEWGVVLVDLRHHGRSEPGTPPNTIAACADDLLALPHVDAIAGHSFGGKVVLAARAQLPHLRQTWVLDASPSARPGGMSEPDNTVVAVLELMERLPTVWSKREDFVAALIAAGQTTALAQWLAMNLVADGGQYVLRLELPALREMLADYYARDLWSEVLRDQPGSVEVVVAERSNTITAADRERLAGAPPHVHVHRIAAGHWLHIDAPDAVVALLAATL